MMHIRLPCSRKPDIVSLPQFSRRGQRSSALSTLKAGISRPLLTEIDGEYLETKEREDDMGRRKRKEKGKKNYNKVGITLHLEVVSKTSFLDANTKKPRR